MIVCPDVSFYQYKFRDSSLNEITEFIDFNQMRAQTPAVIIRAGQGTYKDIVFDVSWRAAREAGLQRGSYWFYDSRVNPKRQAEKWAEVLGNDTGELELWCDFEDNYMGGFQGMKSWYDFMERMRVLLPHKQLGVYTGYYYWWEHLNGLNSYFARYPLWIAGYDSHAPLIPPPWDNWLMWQFTDSGNGALYGVKSHEIDLNYRRGGLAETTTRLIADFGTAKVEYASAG